MSADPSKRGWINPDLVYRGIAPPRSKIWADDEWLKLDREQVYAIQKDVILNQLLQRSTASGKPRNTQELKELTRLFRLAERVVKLRYIDVKKDLIKDYNRGEPVADESSTTRLVREQRILTQIIALATRARFNPLRHKDERESKQHSYLLDLNLRANLTRLNAELIPSFLKNYDEHKPLSQLIDQESLTQYLDLPKEYDQRVLLFRRGTLIDQSEGYFLFQKFNLIFDHIFEQFLRPLHKWVDQLSNQSQESELTPVKNIRNTSEQTTVNSSDILPKWVRRLNLRHESWNLRSIFHSTLLQEPAHQQVLCIFKLHPPPDYFSWRELPGIRRLFGTEKDRSRRAHLRLKLFEKIPIADLELIFPEIWIEMRKFDRFMLYFFSIIGIVGSLINSLSSSQQHNLFFIFISLIGILITKTLFRFINLRRSYLLQIAQDLYDKNINNDEGVIHFLVDQVETQSLCEALICYTLLYDDLTQSDQKSSIDQLQHRGERFFFEHAQLELSVPMQRLIRDQYSSVPDPNFFEPSAQLPLFHRTDSSSLTATSVDEAIQALQNVLYETIQFTPSTHHNSSIKKVAPSDIQSASDQQIIDHTIQIQDQ